ncbi:hypothetical protein BDZ91DRAFT_719755 [Kalaharituber pfeilii]|nr:hypothetical protein BDZ91DRAFT_719755 [Kalaharituber pfeilii]
MHPHPQVPPGIYGYPIATAHEDSSPNPHGYRYSDVHLAQSRSPQLVYAHGGGPNRSSMSPLLFGTPTEHPGAAAIGAAQMPGYEYHPGPVRSRHSHVMGLGILSTSNQERPYTPYHLGYGNVAAHDPAILTRRADPVTRQALAVLDAYPSSEIYPHDSASGVNVGDEGGADAESTFGAPPLSRPSGASEEGSLLMSTVVAPRGVVAQQMHMYNLERVESRFLSAAAGTSAAHGGGGPATLDPVRNSIELYTKTPAPETSGIELQDDPKGKGKQRAIDATEGNPHHNPATTSTTELGADPLLPPLPTTGTSSTPRTSPSLLRPGAGSGSAATAQATSPLSNPAFPRFLGRHARNESAGTVSSSSLRMPFTHPLGTYSSSSSSSSSSTSSSDNHPIPAHTDSASQERSSESPTVHPGPARQCTPTFRAISATQQSASPSPPARNLRHPKVTSIHTWLGNTTDPSEFPDPEAPSVVDGSATTINSGMWEWTNTIVDGDSVSCVNKPRE